VADRDDFDQRLQQARARHGLEPTPKGGGRLPAGPWGVGFRAGVEFFSAVLVGLGIGWLLDRWLGTTPWLLLVFLLAGGAAGVMNVYRLFDPRRGAR
jgi:ATP synthase protein I